MRHKTLNREDEKKTSWHLSQYEFKALVILAILLLAGIAMDKEISNPVVWSFLGTALGMVFGYSTAR